MSEIAKFVNNGSASITPAMAGKILHHQAVTGEDPIIVAITGRRRPEDIESAELQLG